MTRSGAPLAKPARPRHRAALAIIGLIAGICLTACDGPANGSSDALKRLATIQVLTAAPPGGVVIGKGKDNGSDSSITGRDPGLTTIYAVPQTVADTVTYYQRTYPTYRIHEDCCPTAQKAQLVGENGWASIGIDITTGAPHLTPYYNLKPTAAPADDPTYVTVNATMNALGQPPKS